MDKNNTINDKIVQLFDKWSKAETQRRLYGPNTPQTKNAIRKLFTNLEETLPLIKNFSIIRKSGEIEIVVSQNENPDHSAPDTITVNAPAVLKAFERLNINSLTFYEGIAKEELDGLFNGLNLPPEQMEKYSGLKGYLSESGVAHIKADQLEFRLLTETDEAKLSGDSGGSAAGSLPDGKTVSGEKVTVDKKLFDSVWKGYLTGGMEKNDLAMGHNEALKFAEKNPVHFAKLLRSLTKKQKKVEEFLSNLEQKLFDVGFPPEAVQSIKEKLSKPKKVSISEDELARLRKIERESQGTIDQRVEKSIKHMKKVQRSLADEKERTDAILRQISQGTLVLDKNGKILSINPVAQKVLGIVTKDIQGKSLSEVVKDDNMLSMVDNWQSESGGDLPKEVRIQSQNSDIVDTIRESSIVIEDENGKPIGVLSSLQNAAEHKEMEKRKNDLLDVLGHDLRAPICAAKQNLAVLKDITNSDIKFTPEQGKFLSLCEQSIERAEKLVSRILDVRQLETGKIMLKKETTDINKLLDESVTSLVSWAKNKKISLKSDFDPMPSINIDPERIYQVITNLISNALKFTPENGVVLVAGKAHGEFVEISVQDSVVGIEEKDLSRIFNKYEQVSLKAPYGASGLGLGLAICKSIIELHGGKIWAESKPNEGSIFKFQLPTGGE